MDIDFVRLYFWEVFAPLVLILILCGLAFRKAVGMGIIALCIVLLVSGCKDDKKGPWDDMRTLYPEDVTRLENVCSSQPEFYKSRVITHKSEAKDVVCTFRAGDGGVYEMRASVLEIKILEKMK